MTFNRHGEEGATPIRQERVFQNGDYWYYKTREKVNIGPFDTLQDACNGVSEFVEYISCAPAKAAEVLSLYAGAA